MKLSDLLARFRYESDDNKTPYLWPDVLVTQFANEAVVEACRRARLILDGSSDLCSVDFSAGDEVVPLDPRIMFVRRVILGDRDRPLRPMWRKALDNTRIGWENDTGLPEWYVRDFGGGLRLYPTPDEAGTIRLLVVREPLKALAAPGDVPEIPVRWHPSLLFWMLHLAFRKKDSAQDQRDDKLSDKYAAMFAEEFGAKSPAKDELWIEQEYDVDDAQGGTF